MRKLLIGACLMTELELKRDRLLDCLRSYKSCVVALSGGVDSAVVAKAAYLALGEQSLAVTGTSASLASGELETAQSVAREIGIRHEAISTTEFSQPAYTQNASDRCYHCKTELYTQLAGINVRFGMAEVANGANLDDCGDYRPGMQAATEHQVRSPLIECELNKQDVRLLAEHWSLPVWDKPASPCLSSRVAYGEEVTPERLAMIDSGEQYLRSLGLTTVRVRYHRGDLARLEVPTEALPQLVNAATRQNLLAHFQQLGFKYITLDLAGFRSGSLNNLLPIESLTKF